MFVTVDFGYLRISDRPVASTIATWRDNELGKLQYFVGIMQCLGMAIETTETFMLLSFPLENAHTVRSSYTIGNA